MTQHTLPVLLLLLHTTTGQFGPTVNLQWDANARQFFMYNPYQADWLGQSTDVLDLDMGSSKISSKSTHGFKFHFLSNEDLFFTCPDVQHDVETMEQDVFTESVLRCKSNADQRRTMYFAHGDQVLRFGKQYYFELHVNQLNEHLGAQFRVGVGSMNAYVPGSDQHREWTVGSDGSWAVTGVVARPHDPQNDTLWGSSSFDGWEKIAQHDLIGVFVNLRSDNPTITFMPVRPLCEGGDNIACPKTATSDPLEDRRIGYNLTLSIDGFQRIILPNQQAPQSAKPYADNKATGQFGHEQFAKQKLDQAGIGSRQQLSLNGVEFDFEMGRFGGYPPSVDPIHQNVVAANPLNGCGQLENAVEIRGSVAFMLRGECDFIEKAIYAERAGAVALIVANYDSQTAVPRQELVIMDAGDDPRVSQVTIPCVFVTVTTGEFVMRKLKKSGASSSNKNQVVVATLRGSLFAPPHHGPTSKDHGLVPILWLTQHVKVTTRSYQTPPRWVSQSGSQFNNGLKTYVRNCRPATFWPLAQTAARDLRDYPAASQDTRTPPSKFQFRTMDDVLIDEWKRGSKRLLRTALVCGEQFLRHAVLPNKRVTFSIANFAPWWIPMRDAKPPKQGIPSWALVPWAPPGDSDSLQESDNNWSICSMATEMYKLVVLDDQQIPSTSYEFKWKAQALSTSSTCVYARASASLRTSAPVHLGLISKRFNEDLFAASIRTQALVMFDVEVFCDPLTTLPTSIPNLAIGLLSTAYDPTSQRYREFSIDINGHYELRDTIQMKQSGRVPFEVFNGKSNNLCDKLVTSLSVLVNMEAGTVSFLSRGTRQGDLLVVMHLGDSTKRHGTMVDELPKVAWGWTSKSQFPPIQSTTPLSLSSLVPFVRLQTAQKVDAQLAATITERPSSVAQRLESEFYTKRPDCRSLSQRVTVCNKRV